MPRAYLAKQLNEKGKPTSKWFAATSMPNLKKVIEEEKAPDGDYKIEQHILRNNSQQLCALLMRRGFSEHILMTARGTVEDGVLSIKRGSTEKFDKPEPKKAVKKGKHPKSSVKKLFKNKKK